MCNGLVECVTYHFWGIVMPRSGGENSATILRFNNLDFHSGLGSSDKKRKFAKKEVSERRQQLAQLEAENERLRQVVIALALQLQVVRENQSE
jgi:hypothetical protein